MGDHENEPSTGKRKEPERDSWSSEKQAMWAACPRLGQVVNDPRITSSIPGFVSFIPCKPPLTGAASEALEEGDRFDATMFIDRQVNSRRDVGLIVGLIDPKSGIPVQKDWEDWDAQFVSITPESARQVYGEFQKAVSSFHKSEPRRCVAVFCEDGYNLTGYCIVSFLHLVYKIPLADAIKMYTNARAPGIFHKPYLEDLFELYGGGSKNTPPAPAAPEWFGSSVEIVPAHGQFALPVTRPQAATNGRNEAAPPALPPGWTEHWSKTHNKKYYFNKATGKQSWDFPVDKSAPPPPGGSGSGSGAAAQAAAWHILIKHSKSRKPSSWRDKEGGEIMRRTVEDARRRVESLRAQILAAPDPRAKFAEIARVESDCSSANKGGDLGTFARGKMQPAFEKATFDLPVGEISGPIESDSGVHIILRTG